MTNGGLPGKPTKLSVSAGEDIPVAQRDTPDAKSRRWNPVFVAIGLFGLVLSAIAIGLSASTRPQPQSLVTASPTPTATVSPDLSNADVNQGVDLEGRRHFAYKEAPESDLQAITPDGGIKLRTSAARKFQAMAAAARAEGVLLVPLSGFRSVAEQQHLFFGIKAQRGQVATKRAEVSAPPGYSEHHTGYAIDIGDAKTPATNLSPAFENTAAFKWLEQNAPRYNFELSFPRGNAQGINYEPWHWRFVGDRDSLETFYKTENLTPSPSTPATTPEPNTTLTPEAELVPDTAPSPDPESVETP